MLEIAKIPILGINAGRLGFLAKVQKDNIETFLKIVLEKNILFQAELCYTYLATPETMK
jgi:NAD+ kinase